MKTKTTTKTTTAKLNVNIVHGGRNENAWTHGTATVNGAVYTFDVKHFDEGSDWGLKGGRISKLSIGNDEGYLVNFDRGWDRRPQTEETKAVFKALVDRFNKPSETKAKAHRDTTYTEADLEAAAEDLKQKALVYYRLRARTNVYPGDYRLWDTAQQAKLEMNKAQHRVGEIAAAL